MAAGSIALFLLGSMLFMSGALAQEAAGDIFDLSISAMVVKPASSIRIVEPCKANRILVLTRGGANVREFGDLGSLRFHL